MLDITSSNSARIQLDYDEVHAKSVDLLKYLEKSDATVSSGIAALVMSIGRLLSPKTMNVDSEIHYIQDCLDWHGMYFSDGGMN